MVNYEVKISKIDNLSCYAYDIDMKNAGILVIYKNVPIKIINASIIIPEQFFLLEEYGSCSTYSKSMNLFADKSIIESEIIPKIKDIDKEVIREKIKSQNGLQIIYEKEKLKYHEFFNIYLSGENNFEGNILSYKIGKSIFENFKSIEINSFLYKHEIHSEQEIHQEGCFIKRHYFKICCYITLFLFFIIIYENIE